MQKKRERKFPFAKSSFKTKLLLISGILLVIVPIFFYLNEGIQLAFFTPKVPVVSSIGSKPVSIKIPTVNIDLPVEETAISNKAWQVAQTGASHLAISANPGKKGPIILYGHNTNERFGPIRWLKQGQEIDVVTDDGKSHKYKISKTEEVSPNSTTIFNTKEEVLFLYTCDGFADLQRFVVIAMPAMVPE